MFVDTARISITAGNGGNGAVSFHREKYVAAGGPDGGDGADGGNVIFVADKSLSTLMDMRYKKKYKAQNGAEGGGAKCSGKKGEDIIVRLPCGTLIKDAESGRIIADLTQDGQSFIAARGGRGGWGNAHFANPVRQAPRFAKPGTRGEIKEIILELKLLADVGLVGFPNVGKSTLLSVVSSARPKIANYHFTTIEPNLGVVEIDKGASFVLADIPGLIEGAHTGVGLGHSFLRHIERTRLLIHVVDVSGSEGRDPLQDFETIHHELENYGSKLAGFPQIIAANKTDLCASSESYNEFVEEMKRRGYPVFEISAATSLGVRELMQYAFARLQEIPVAVTEVEEEFVQKENVPPFTVRRENEKFIVEGPYIQYLIDSTNFGDTESLQFFQDSLRRKGIVQALEDAGVKEGNTVSLYDIEFDFVY